MVTFARYTQLAYEIAKSRPWYSSEMTGEGSRRANNQFIQELARAYNANDHSEATEAQARRFLKENIGPP